MRLPDYIKHVGVDEFCAALKVKPRTAQSWMRRERYPRPEQAQKIVAKLPLTMEDIYGKAA